MNKIKRGLALVGLLVAVLVVSGCGGGGEPSSGTVVVNPPVNAAVGTISGKTIIPGTTTPLAGVIVSINATDITTVSDANGLYSLTSPVGQQTLLFMKVGYTPSVSSVSVAEGSTTVYNKTLVLFVAPVTPPTCVVGTIYNATTNRCESTQTEPSTVAVEPSSLAITLPIQDAIPLSATVGGVPTVDVKWTLLNEVTGVIGTDSVRNYGYVYNFPGILDSPRFASFVPFSVGVFHIRVESLQYPSSSAILTITVTK